MTSRPRPVVLCILDGWGERPDAPDNAIEEAKTPVWHELMRRWPHAHLDASEHYVGTVSKFGVDIGYTEGGVLVWGVFAPSSDVRAGALQGDYAGATASATVGVGLGANVLIGGLDKSIALQPVSVEGNRGLNVAAGIGAISLKSSP